MTRVFHAMIQQSSCRIWKGTLSCFLKREFLTLPRSTLPRRDGAVCWRHPYERSSFMSVLPVYSAFTAVLSLRLSLLFCSFSPTVDVSYLFVRLWVLLWIQARTPRGQPGGRDGDGGVAATLQQPSSPSTSSSSLSASVDWRALSVRFPLEMWEGAISFFRSSSSCLSSSA